MINSSTEDQRKNVSLEQVRDWHREREAYWSTGVGGKQHENPTTFSELHKGLADAIDADQARQAKAISNLQDQLAAKKACTEAWKTKRDPVLEAHLEAANNERVALMAKLRTVRQHILEDGDNHYRLAEIDAILDAAPATPGCGCESCRPITLGDMRMILCPICGNKRCPRAHNHRNACTNSNAVGQPGSSWEHVQPPGSLTPGE